MVLVIGGTSIIYSGIGWGDEQPDQHNTCGDVRGKEVVQLYINDKVSSVSTPVKVLKGFQKIEIETGAFEV